MEREEIYSESLGMQNGYRANVFEDGDCVFFGSLIVAGDVIIMGELGVNGLICIKGDLYVEGSLDAFDLESYANYYSLYVDGNVYIGKNIDLIANMEVTGSIICNGDINSTGRILADSISVYGSLKAEEVIANHIQIKENINVSQNCYEDYDNEYDDDYDDYE